MKSRSGSALILAWVTFGLMAHGAACTSSGGGNQTPCAAMCEKVADCGGATCLAQCVNLEASCTIAAQSSTFQAWVGCGPRFACQDDVYATTNCAGETKAVAGCAAASGQATGTTTGSATASTTATTTGTTTANTTTGTTTATMTTGTTTGGKLDGGKEADGASKPDDASPMDSSGTSNLITNGDFSMGTVDWGIPVGVATLTIQNGMGCVAVEAAEVLVVLGWPAESDAAATTGIALSGSYTFSYSASSTLALPLGAKVGETGSPYTADFESMTDAVTTTPTVFTHTFTATDPSAGVAFSLPGSASSYTVCFQNVSLVKD